MNIMLQKELMGEVAPEDKNEKRGHDDDNL